MEEVSHFSFSSTVTAQVVMCGVPTFSERGVNPGKPHRPPTSSLWVYGGFVETFPSPHSTNMRVFSADLPSVLAKGQHQQEEVTDLKERSCGPAGREAQDALEMNFHLLHFCAS